MNITERINRILSIMSCVSQNQGISVDDLARRVDLKPKQLLKELEFMLLIGKPPFRPDDYVDIYVEDERVFIEFDQMLNRPLRFTRAEAVALLVSLQLLDPEVDPQVVDSLEQKIESAISRSLDPAARLEDRIILDRPSRPISSDFTCLRRAIEENKKIEMEYYALVRNKTTTRVVRPYFLMKHLGYWYLTGYCELRKDLRTFKFERILSVRMLDQKFAPAHDFDLHGYKENFLRSMGRQRFEIHFDASVAPWILEQWGDSARSGPDGGAILTLHSETLEYPSRLVLGFAPHARPVSPPELIEKVREDARGIARLYEKTLAL